MSAIPGPSRPNPTTPLLASPRGATSLPRDLSAVRYHTLPSLDRLPSKRRRHTPHIQFIPFILAGSVFLLVLLIAWDVSSFGNCYFKPLCRMLGDGSLNSREVWWMNSGPYAPWKPVGPGGGRRGLPRGCEIDQVNVVGEQLGGARSPHRSYELTRGTAAPPYCSIPYIRRRPADLGLAGQAAG